MRHFFNQSEESQSNTDLAISLHVLQVFRAEAEVVTPSNGAVLNVSERTETYSQIAEPWKWRRFVFAKWKYHLQEISRGTKCYV